MKKGFNTIDPNKLVEADWNYKTNNDEKQEKLKNNIKRNGQIENLIIRPLDTGFYEVVNGNHRLRVLQELSFKEVQVYNLGEITLKQAQRIAIETNETKFETDNVKLADLIKDLGEEFSIEEMTETMPYTGEELNDFSNLTDFDWNQYEKEDEEEEVEREGKTESKVINIQVADEDYKEMLTLFEFWQKKNVYIGRWIIELLEDKKKELTKNNK